MTCLTPIPKPARGADTRRLLCVHHVRDMRYMRYMRHMRYMRYMVHVLCAPRSGAFLYCLVLLFLSSRARAARRA